ncbi:MAG: hypothetical protein HY043_09155 [Verrucomicrobia bacterium]|nr:hypothetical protein [Verrucomicrobiota bacterium]
MFATAELNALEARKKLLVVKSEVYRATLALECARLDESVGWVDRGIGFARQTYPILVLLAPLAGYFLVARKSIFRGVLTKATFGWQMYRRVWPLVKALFAEK